MVTIKVEDLHCHLDADGGLLSYVSQFLRTENDFWARQHNERIPKYKYYITDKGNFLSGFLPRVLSVLKMKGVKVNLVDKRSVKSMPDLGDVKRLIDDMEIDGNPLVLRDYQLDALVAGLKQTRGVFDMATGAGKTLCMAALMLAWDKKALVVINSKDLARQLQREIADYTQRDVGFIGDGIWDPQQITVGIDKSLVSKSKKAKAYLKTVEYLVGDEIHHMQSKTWRLIARRCVNAGIRHGFSGTPVTSEVKKEAGGTTSNDMMIEGYIGPHIFTITTRDLIDMGYLSDVKVYIVKNELYFDNNCLPYMKEYERIVVKDEIRNEILCDIIARGRLQGKQVIGFVDRVQHGEDIREKLIEDYGIPGDEIMYVHGSSYSREEDLEKFKNQEVPILFGTVLSEGLNFICDIGLIMSGGKSAKDLKQKAGRILRKPKTETGDVDTESDRWVQLYDCSDDGHPWFSKHRRARVKTYKSDGYEVTFVEHGEIDEIEGK